MRDPFLDRLRGLTMMWVVFVHVPYWTGLFSEYPMYIIKSFLLIEMPLLFFITGASNTFSTKRSYLSFIRKKYARILVPYWVYSIVCFILTILFYFNNGESPSVLKSAKILILWLVPIDRQVTPLPYLTWALWYIPIYLIVIATFPLLMKIQKSRFRYTPFLILPSFVCVFDTLNIGVLQSVSFYLIWTYLGLYYPIIVKCAKEKCLGIWVLIIETVCALIILALLQNNGILDMQVNKFPPNMMFLAFSVLFFGILFQSSRKLNTVMKIVEGNRTLSLLVEKYSQHSMTIFLYQSFIFGVLTYIVRNTVLDSLPDFMKFLIYLFIAIPACSVFAILFGKAKKISTLVNRP